MKEKIYYDDGDILVSNKGYTLRPKDVNVSPEQLTGVVEQDIISLPDKTRAVAVFIMACFVFSEATVSRALLPSWFAYVVTGILFILSYYYWIRTEIVVYYELKKGFAYDNISVTFSKQSHVLEFIDAMNAMLRDYSANQNHAKQNSNLDKDIQTVANGIIKAQKILENKKREAQNRLDAKKAELGLK